MRQAFTAAVLTILISGEAAAASVAKMRAINIGAQAVLTTAGAIFQGNVSGWCAAGRAMLTGAVAGAGAFEGKMMIRRGEIGQGWLLANAALSLAENAAAGRHPLAQFGYSFGPMRVRVAVPHFDAGGDSYIYVDASLYEAVQMIRERRINKETTIRNGMVAFRRDTPYPGRDGFSGFVGYTYGIFPGVQRHGPRDIWSHETIHAVQVLQSDAVDPALPISWLNYTPRPRPGRRLIRFDHLKFGLFTSMIGTATDQKAYNDRWTEVEAYRLAENRRP